MPSLHVLVGLLYLGSLSLLSELHGANSSGSVESTSNASGIQHVGDNCDHHTTTTSQFEEYFDIDEIGNNRSEQNVIDLTLFVQVHNMQEELAILLSASNRSRQHPDYGQTYEVRVSNVYTVIYRETLRMSAHHSHNFNFFPSEQFRLRILITRTGHITVSIPGLQKSLILAVEDERTPIEVEYISFGSRMNAYPVTFYFSCLSSAEARARQRRPPTPVTPVSRISENARLHTPPGDTGRGRHDLDEDDDSEDDDGHENGEDDRTPARHPQTGPPGPTIITTTTCPVCPRPEKCEVIVKACSDTSRDLLMQPTSGADDEKQKYFFYFNVYLSRKGEKGKAADLSPASVPNALL
uniref:Farnesoic acid O-methyl transferase domain-containing protein n=1 Tax=Anopheles atroparvus TaxID=41427 RepID=A0A182IKQ0_ANOAO